ncbi:unnamed protein product [Ambrosiozyma monospora]|uniref:Unnamed protein product n=1 Tax=Ambrosiozyma monospora TaxID=43982 RepID=A0ACB5TYA4_AMBMO|nr:unnamed protein product [Ambrosiozyma monospora]
MRHPPLSIHTPTSTSKVAPFAKLVYRAFENVIVTFLGIVIAVVLSRVGLLPPVTELLSKFGFFTRTQTAVELVDILLKDDAEGLEKSLDLLKKERFGGVSNSSSVDADVGVGGAGAGGRSRAGSDSVPVGNSTSGADPKTVAASDVDKEELKDVKKADVSDKEYEVSNAADAAIKEAVRSATESTEKKVKINDSLTIITEGETTVSTSVARNSESPTNVHPQTSKKRKRGSRGEQ